MLTLIKDWWTRQDDLHRLRGIDDRLLADMGLSRDGLGAGTDCRAASLPVPRPATAMLCLSMTLRS